MKDRFCQLLLFFLILFLPLYAIEESLQTNQEFKQENIYTPESLNQRETALRNIANHIEQYQFVLLNAGNTTPTTWRVQKNHHDVAVLKCTSGNNYAKAEIAAYYILKLDRLRTYNLILWPILRYYAAFFNSNNLYSCTA